MAANFNLILDTAPPRLSLAIPGVVAENDLVSVYISANEDLDADMLSLWVKYPDGSTEDVLIAGDGRIYAAEINLIGKGLGNLELTLTACDIVWNQTSIERSVSVLPVVNRIITIAGNPVIVQQNTLNITDRINSRSTASFRVFSKNNEQKYNVGQEVTIIDNGDTIFAGTISNVLETSETRNDVIYQINAVDYCQLIDKRVVAKTYENKTVGYIVRDMINSIFSDEGITEGNIIEGPLIKKAVFNYMKGSEALNGLLRKPQALTGISTTRNGYILNAVSIAHHLVYRIHRKL